MKSVAAGMNPMDLKRGIDLAVIKVVEDLKARSKPVSGSNEIAQVGIISANGDTVVGEKIAEAMDKVGKEGVITVEEAKGLEFELDVVEGIDAGVQVPDHRAGLLDGLALQLQHQPQHPVRRRVLGTHVDDDAVVVLLVDQGSQSPPVTV